MSDGVDWSPVAALDTLRRRAALLARLRAIMADRGLFEVDTGTLVRAPAAERGLCSFRVEDAGWLAGSPEYALKRLLAAGAGPLYQLGHVFRAGEAGRWHNPEFCLLEWYRPQAQVAAVIDDMAALLAEGAGTPPMARADYRELFIAHAGIDPMAADADVLRTRAKRLDVAPLQEPARDRAFWLDLLMSLVVQPELGHDGPLCVTGFPADDAVLVESCERDPRVSQRFEVYWQGVELANGAQELTDAAVARARMAGENAARRAAGERPMPEDNALLAAMAHGLPPCAGVAVGVDRLLALMLGCDRLAPVLAFDWSRR